MRGSVAGEQCDQARRDHADPYAAPGGIVGHLDLLRACRQRGRRGGSSLWPRPADVLNEVAEERSTPKPALGLTHILCWISITVGRAYFRERRLSRIAG